MTTWKMTVAMAWMTAGAACYGASTEVSLTQASLTVVVFDMVGVARPTLDAAGREAQSAFRAAGVESTWTVCQVSSDPTHHCTLPPAGTYMQVKLIARPVDARSLSRENFAYATLCRPTDGCSTSYVFYSRVLAYAQAAGRSVAVALAYVMAHEVAHLMGLNHTPTGVMKPHFDRHDLQDASLGRFRFADEDGRRLRTAVALWTAATAG